MSVERVEKLESDVHSMKKEMDEMKIDMAVAKSDIKTIKTSIAKIDANTTWTVRLIIGFIILAILGFVFKGGVN